MIDLPQSRWSKSLSESSLIPEGFSLSPPSSQPDAVQSFWRTPSLCFLWHKQAESYRLARRLHAPSFVAPQSSKQSSSSAPDSNDRESASLSRSLRNHLQQSRPSWGCPWNWTGGFLPRRVLRRKHWSFVCCRQGPCLCGYRRGTYCRVRWSWLQSSLQGRWLKRGSRFELQEGPSVRWRWWQRCRVLLCRGCGSLWALESFDWHNRSQRCGRGLKKMISGQCQRNGYNRLWRLLLCRVWKDVRLELHILLKAHRSA